MRKIMIVQLKDLSIVKLKADIESGEKKGYVVTIDYSWSYQRKWLAV